MGRRRRIVRKALAVVVMLAILVAIAPMPIGSMTIRQSGIGGGSSVGAITDLRIMTYNILWKGQTDERLDQIAETIKERRIDIVAFQECHGFYDDGPEWRFSWGNREDTVGYIQGRLSELGWEMLYISPRYARDLRVLSRYPISEYESIEPRNGQTMVISVGGEKIRIFNFHSRAPSMGCEGVKHLLEVAQTYSDYPKFLLGDFNAGKEEYCHDLAAEDYRDACDPTREVSCEDTVNDAVVNRLGGVGIYHYAIDYIYVERGSPWRIVRCFVDRAADTSDHFPVIAILVLRDGKGDKKITYPKVKINTLRVLFLGWRGVLRSACSRSRTQVMLI